MLGRLMTWGKGKFQPAHRKAQGRCCVSHERHAASSDHQAACGARIGLRGRRRRKKDVAQRLVASAIKEQGVVANPGGDGTPRVMPRNRATHTRRCRRELQRRCRRPQPASCIREQRVESRGRESEPRIRSPAEWPGQGRARFRQQSEYQSQQHVDEELRRLCLDAGANFGHASSTESSSSATCGSMKSCSTTFTVHNAGRGALQRDEGEK